MLTIFDESTPWTTETRRKYAEYIKLRNEGDKFLKSLKAGWYGEWLIHKKLLEAGGIGDTVYILPARGGGTSFRTLKKINDLLEEGRDVQVVHLHKQDWLKLTPKDIDVVRESIRQHELYAEFVKPWCEPLYQQLFKDFEPQGGWTLDPCWTIDTYGHLRLREVSLVRKDYQRCP